MQYLITFLEGLISFISPCMLPMLPVYISYFSGGEENYKALLRSLCFVSGFSLVFCIMGLFAGSLGALLNKYQTVIQILCGMIIILFGASYLGAFKLPLFKGIHKQTKVTGMFSAFVFGIVFSVSHMPCVGVFLGSALAMASANGTALEGVLMLGVYSLGMAVPFIMSAVIIERLKNTFDVIKKHYNIINPVCGIFLVIVGIMMCFGIFDSLTQFVL